MAMWLGGSCPAMAGQIADGYILLSAANLKGFTPADLTALKQELDKLLRGVRAEVPPADDAFAQQSRNRKIGRLSSAVQIVQNQMTAR